MTDDATRLRILSEAALLFNTVAPDREQLMQSVARRIAELTADACTVRLLSDDGQQLFPTAAHHADPVLRAAILDVMHRTTRRAEIGLWRPVIEEQRVIRVAVRPDHVPPGLSEPQRELLDRHPASGVMAAPLVARGRVIGGIALVRFGYARGPYDEADELLVRDLADRAALAIDNALLIRADRVHRIEREHAEAVSRQSQLQLQGLIDSAMDAIVTVDDEQRIVLFNPAAERLFGWQAADVLGRTLDVLLPDRFHTTHHQHISQFGRTGGTARAMGHQLPLAALRADGTECPVEVSISQVIVGGRRLFSAIIRDITERQQSEAALLAAERQALQTEKLRVLGQMASGIAHDLNQGLALVSGYSELAAEALDQQPPDVARAREMLAIVGQAAGHGGEAVKRVLTFGRPRADRPAERIDLLELLHEVARLTAPRWREIPRREGRPIALRVEAEDDAAALGWPSDLAEALTNLVFNAVDALPDGGTIELRARRSGDAVHVEVADSGVGMPAEVQAQIFDPFFSTKGERGTGLGLTMVFATVEQHRGRIAVDSAPGRGTTFRITLPPAQQVARPAAAPADVAGARPHRILAVDDQPALARMIALMLESRGHRVATVLSAEEALVRLAAESFDLVITDLGLGVGMNGLGLAEQVKQRWPAVRVVLATGWGAAIDPGEASAHGIEAVISKPYRYAALERLLTGGS